MPAKSKAPRWAFGVKGPQLAKDDNKGKLPAKVKKAKGKPRGQDRARGHDKARGY